MASVRAGRDAHPRIAPDPIGQSANRREPLPFSRVDEMLRDFLSHHQLSGWAAPPMLNPKTDQFYSPSQMPAHTFQNAADASALQRQAEVHLNVAALLCAFAFAAAATEGALQSSEVASAVDQAIFINLTLCTVLLLGTLMHFMYIDMGLGTRGGRRYWQAYSGKLGVSCVSFHLGCALLIATFPLWAYRKFELQPAFLVTLCFAILWVVYDIALLLQSHDKFNQILAHAEMGVDADRRTLNQLAAGHRWTQEGWERMHQLHQAGRKDQQSEE